jgi:hypothetical protein
MCGQISKLLTHIPPLHHLSLGFLEEDSILINVNDLPTTLRSITISGTNIGFLQWFPSTLKILDMGHLEVEPTADIPNTHLINLTSSLHAIMPPSLLSLSYPAVFNYPVNFPPNLTFIQFGKV